MAKTQSGIYPNLNQAQQANSNTLTSKEKKALFKEKFLINEIKALKIKLENELDAIKITDISNNSATPNKKLTKKAKKFEFLNDVIEGFNQESKAQADAALPKSLAECIKEKAHAFDAASRHDVIAGTFSRVNKLMVKVLGDSKTVKTLFAKPKLGKEDLTNLTGDALFAAKIRNLIQDLEKETSSIWPTGNKERKLLKKNFLSNMLSEYEIKLITQPTFTLKDCYKERYASLTPIQQTSLMAGRNSRVAALLSELESYNHLNNKAPTPQVI